MEEELYSIDGLRFTIVRPAIIYGIGDRHGLGRFLCHGENFLCVVMFYIQKVAINPYEWQDYS